MDSGISVNRRIPQQERGERRVRELLQASASEFAEVGYDAATMKAIAKRARASIGAVYQYFPNKESVASALRTQYVNEIEEQWINLETASLSIKERAQHFVDVMIRFMDEHPAYVTIFDAPANSKRDKKTRDQLHERLAKVLRTRTPSVSQEQAYRVACVSLQIIKGMNALYSRANSKERLEIAKEYKFALGAYLAERLNA